MMYELVEKAFSAHLREIKDRQPEGVYEFIKSNKTVICTIVDEILNSTEPNQFQPTEETILGIADRVDVERERAITLLHEAVIVASNAAFLKERSADDHSGLEDPRIVRRRPTTADTYKGTDPKEFENPTEADY